MLLTDILEGSDEEGSTRLLMSEVAAVQRRYEFGSGGPLEFGTLVYLKGNHDPFHAYESYEDVCRVWKEYLASDLQK